MDKTKRYDNVSDLLQSIGKHEAAKELKGIPFGLKLEYTVWTEGDVTESQLKTIQDALCADLSRAVRNLNLHLAGSITPIDTPIDSQGNPLLTPRNQNNG